MKISVLIPVFNGERYIKAAIDSVFSQTYPVHEIIVLNDGSKDNCAGIIKQIPEIVYIETPHGGIAKARNRLIRESSGEWVAFLDADDLWHPEKLEKQAAYLQEHPGCSIVMCGIESFLDECVLVPSMRQLELVQAKYPCLLSAALIHKELFARFGFFNEGYHHSEDTDWFMRLSANGVSVREAAAEVLCYYRIHNSNTMLRSDMNRESYFQMIAAAARKRNKPKEQISVVIPAWNAEKYLAEAVSSIQRQTLPEGVSSIEIIIIDDGSTDRTAEIASDLQNVRLFQIQHSYAATARNEGVRQAQGSLLLFLDADDILCDDAIVRLYKPFSDDSALSITLGLAEDFISPELSPEQRSVLFPRAQAYSGLLSGCSLMRKSLFQDNEVGFFDETLRSGETVEWFLRLHDRKLKTFSVGYVTVGRRLHLSNTGRIFTGEEHKNYAFLLRRRLKKRFGADENVKRQ